MEKMTRVAVTLGMSLTLGGAGRDPSPGADPLVAADELRPEALVEIEAALRGEPGRFEVARREPANPALGRGALVELVDRHSGASVTRHEPPEGLAEAGVICEIRDAGLLVSLATPEAIDWRRAEMGEEWERALERDAFAAELGRIWGCAESRFGESDGYRVARFVAAAEIVRGAGVYGPALFDLEPASGRALGDGEAMGWRLERAENGILAAERRLFRS